MSETKHTPGPWVFEYGCVFTVARKPARIDAQMGVRIALMDRDEENTIPTERDANARLIAAAPDGYQLAQDLVVLADDVESIPYPLKIRFRALCTRAEQFLAKAEGK